MCMLENLKIMFGYIKNRFLIFNTFKTTLWVVFLFCTKEVTAMYRPQYLEQKHEVITVQNGNGEIVRKYRRPIKSDTYKRKENNEVISFHRRRKAKWETTGIYH